ncbi:MAG TPA: hypothetical protein VJY33_04755 [Isosphaeraceae bacterium]|nr:hypothetical protein [Isosphaeraceae bacterium]
MSMGRQGEDEGPSSTVDPARDFLEFWRNYFEQTAIQTRILLESMQGGKSLEQLNSQWLDSLSQSLEDFMRTPAFLEVLKQSMRRMIDLKLAQNQQMTQSKAGGAGLPQAADVAGVFDRVRSAERKVLTRLTGIEDRLAAIEKAVRAGSTATDPKQREEPRT